MSRAPSFEPISADPVQVSQTEDPVITRFANYLRSRDHAKTTVEQYVRELRRLSNHYNLKTATTRDLERWIFEEAPSLEAKRQRWKACASFYDYAKQRRWRPTNPMLKLKPPRKANKRMPRPAPIAAVRQVMAETHPTARVAIAVAAFAGLRCSEVCNLQWEHIDWHGETLLVVNGKGGKDRVVPLPRQLAKVLEEYGIKNRGLIIPSRFGGRRSAPSLSGTISKEFQRYGWHIKMHQLRHLYACEAYRAKRNILAVSLLLGHVKLETTMIYVAVSAEEVRESAAGAADAIAA